jgi:5-methylcytosine-specific restriction protein B
MTRLKNLYTHLVKNRLQAVRVWRKHYEAFTEDVKTIQAALANDHGLREAQTYAGTSIEGQEQPFEAFAKQLISQKDNGIASSGQSVLSGEDFRLFIADDKFVEALAALIRTPRRDTFDVFRDLWWNFGKGRRPLLLNRVLAACTLDVSTTVDEGKFQSVYSWLLDEGLIAPATATADDWYSKNVHLMSSLKEHFQKELETNKTNVHLLSIFVWELFVHMTNPFSLKKQVVRYGPPGTGKTHLAIENAKLRFAMWKAEFDPQGPQQPEEHIEKVQFHPSYGYEDFMEGLRPELVNGQSRLCLQNGIFKDLCKRAARWELDVWRNASRELVEKQWSTLTIGELVLHKEKLCEPEWKTFLQLDPKKRVSEAVPPFFLIIDEMNRAELSRVLGELMLCLEYRGISGAVATQYVKLNSADTAVFTTAGGYRFFVPHNVYLIGTMNTIDRSVESFDFALRRRFRWEEVKPDTNVLRYNLEENKRESWLELADDLDRLNEAIKGEALLGPDYQIGHAYLMNLAYPPEFTHSQVRSAVWEDSIAPLIEEYLRGTGKTQELLESFEKAFGIR